MGERGGMRSGHDPGQTPNWGPCEAAAALAYPDHVYNPLHHCSDLISVLNPSAILLARLPL